MTTCISTETTAQSLCTDAIRLLGEYAEGFEDIEGYEQQRAMRFLNRMLKTFALTNKLIPFYTNFEFTMTPGQHSYEVSKIEGADVDLKPLVALNYVGIQVDTLYHPVSIVDNEFLYTKRFSKESQGRPRYVILEKNVNTSSMYFWPAPDQAYVCPVKSKTALTELQARQIISTLPEFWEDFLVYKIAKRLQPFYIGSQWTIGMQTELDKLEQAVQINALKIAPVRIDGGLLYGARQYESSSRIDIENL